MLHHQIGMCCNFQKGFIVDIIRSKPKPILMERTRKGRPLVRMCGYEVSYGQGDMLHHQIGMCCNFQKGFIVDIIRSKPKPILMERTRKGRPLVNLRLGNRPPPPFFPCLQGLQIGPSPSKVHFAPWTAPGPIRKGWLFRGKGGEFQTDLGLDECRKRFFGQLGEAILRQQLVFTPILPGDRQPMPGVV